MLKTPKIKANKISQTASGPDPKTNGKKGNIHIKPPKLTSPLEKNAAAIRTNMPIKITKKPMKKSIWKN